MHFPYRFKELMLWVKTLFICSDHWQRTCIFPNLSVVYNLATLVGIAQKETFVHRCIKAFSIIAYIHDSVGYML